MSSSADIGVVIRAARHRLGLTTDGLGALVDVQPGVVEMWERGAADIDRGRLARVAETLGLPVAALDPESPAVAVAVVPASGGSGGRRPATRYLRRRRTRRAVPGGVVGRAAAVFGRVRERVGLVIADGGLRAAVISSVLAALLVALGLGTLLAGNRAGTRLGAAEGRAVRLEAQLAISDAGRADLAGRVWDLQRAGADAAARAEAAEVRVGDLTDDNERLAAENAFLRGAIVISSASPFVDLVAITFDGDPAPAQLQQVLDTLEAKGAAATFFPDGAGVAARPGVWRRVVAVGNELGNHTFTPVTLGEVPLGLVARELRQWQEAVEAALGRVYPTRWFRPVFDADAVGFGPDAEVRNLLRRRGLVTALWGFDTGYSLYDPDGPRLAGDDPDAGDVAAYLAAAVGPGTIIRMTFDDRDLGALPRLIDAVRGRGLEPVTLSELVAGQEEAFEGEVIPDPGATP